MNTVGIIALGLLSWCALSVPAGLFIARFIQSGKGE